MFSTCPPSRRARFFYARHPAPASTLRVIPGAPRRSCRPARWRDPGPTPTRSRFRSGSRIAPQYQAERSPWRVRDDSPKKSTRSRGDRGVLSLNKHLAWPSPPDLSAPPRLRVNARPAQRPTFLPHADAFLFCPPRAHRFLPRHADRGGKCQPTRKRRMTKGGLGRAK
jgi:hypothetical protein